MSSKNVLCRLLAVGLLSVVAQAHAVQSSVTLTDLPDLVPGQDRWHYDIALSGDLPQYGAVEYAFAFATIASFELVSGAVPVLEVAATPSLPALDADGLLRFTAQSAVNGGSFQFGVDVVSLAGEPGALPFTVFDTNGDIQSTGTAGIVTPPPPIPEPPAALLMACGLLLAPWLARRARA